MSEKRNLCFVFSVYRDEPLAIRLMADIRRAYPEADIICIPDGPADISLLNACRYYRVMRFLGCRLKTLEYGGAWLHRLLALPLMFSGADVIIKLDPDTRIHRRFEAVPEADWFGQLRSTAFYLPIIGGGCMGFSREFAERVLVSEYLLDPLYKDKRFAYQRYGRYRQPGETASDEWIALTDWIIADVAHRLGVERISWREVLINFREPLPVDLSPWAATHPHPLHG